MNEEREWPYEDTGVASDVGRFGIVPEWLLAKVSPRAVLLFAIMGAKYADRVTQTCFPSRKRLALDMGGVSLPTLDKAMAELVEARALIKTSRWWDEGGQRSNVYTLNYAHPSKADLAP